VRMAPPHYRLCSALWPSDLLQRLVDLTAGSDQIHRSPAGDRYRVGEAFLIAPVALGPVLFPFIVSMSALQPVTSSTAGCIPLFPFNLLFLPQSSLLQDRQLSTSTNSRAWSTYTWRVVPSNREGEIDTKGKRHAAVRCRTQASKGAI
jgi:hypothetical protein